jgi:putative endonuclease
MLFHVYILYSETVQQYYIGHTDDLEDRLCRHTNSGSKATKKANDWKLVHTEFFETKAEAYRHEEYLYSSARGYHYGRNIGLLEIDFL